MRSSTLGSILAVAGVLAGGAGVPIGGEVAQSGAQSGIGNTVFTAWLPAGLAFAGVQGIVSLAGNDMTFSEALVLLGTTADDAVACAGRNDTAVAGFPALRRLWGTILKSNDTTLVTDTANFVLPFAVPVASGGTCLVVVVSAGYPYLSATAARYTDTTVRLNILARPPAEPAAVVAPLGVGGEFRFTPAEMAGGIVYVGIRANQAVAVDAIAGTLSAAPVAGAPAASGWGPLPIGGWLVAAPFYFMSAAVCAAGHFNVVQSLGRVSILRKGIPAAVPVPRGALPVLYPWLRSTYSNAAQRDDFVAYPASGGWNGRLAAGDCLVTFVQAETQDSGLPGIVSHGVV